jgi:Alpha/beta hydrolase family
VNQTEYRVHGVRVERFMPLTPVQGWRPIVFVHGGCHGSWSWVHFLPYFAQAGWDCHALNWFGHNGSAPHPEVGLLQRGIADVTEEIAHVAGQFDEPPVIVAHSMGALAAQKICRMPSCLRAGTPNTGRANGGGWRRHQSTDRPESALGASTIRDRTRLMVPGPGRRRSQNVFRETMSRVTQGRVRSNTMDGAYRPR